MSQSKTWSFIEATAQTVAGYILGVVSQAILFPWYGWEDFSLSANMQLVAIFCVLSFARNYIVRRIFNRIHHRNPS